MANLCSNTLVIKGLDDDMKEAFQTMMEEGKFFSFLLPEPEFKDDASNFKCINWRNANWGSKWDICEAYVQIVGDELHASYESAWAPHNIGIVTLAKMMPELEFKLWYDEGGLDFAGWLTAKGEVVMEWEDCYDSAREPMAALPTDEDVLEALRIHQMG